MMHSCRPLVNEREVGNPVRDFNSGFPTTAGSDKRSKNFTQPSIQKMFGFSLAELLIVCLVTLIFIKPQDLPEIAHFVGKIFFRGKRMFDDLKKQFKEVEKDIGFEEIKHELHRGIAEEKAKLTEYETTVIVDINGNEHVVQNIHEIRSDLTKEEMAEEVKKLNEENLARKSQNNS